MVRRTRSPSNLVAATAPAATGAAAVNGGGPPKQMVDEGNRFGRPTVNISERVETRVIQSVQTDPYFSIKVSTRNATQAQLVVLFDGSKGLFGGGALTAKISDFGFSRDSFPSA